ncbi:MAG: hypothetical protein NZM26_03405 [Patescibacteria group bacterium]|nr:hypothetical protein [Patescibacteria group bacterium]
MAERALGSYLFIELAKFFDKGHKSLSIYKVGSICEKIKSSNVLEVLTDEQGGIVERIRNFRNKWLAHEDIVQPRLPRIAHRDVEELLNQISKILNKISREISEGVWLHDYQEGVVQGDIDRLFEDLGSIVLKKKLAV